MDLIIYYIILIILLDNIVLIRFLIFMGIFILNNRLLMEQYIEILLYNLINIMIILYIIFFYINLVDF